MAVAVSRFGPFLPDVPVFGSEGSAVIRNALPLKGGYKPIRSVSPQTDAVSSDVLAARFSVSSSGASFGFVATATTLESLSTDAFNDVSRAGGYTTATEDTWYFTRFGDLVVASNFTDEMQQFDLSSDTAFSNFPAAAPRGKYISIIGNFLVVAYLNETGTVSPSGIRWSAIRDVTNFPAINILTNTPSDEAVQTLSDRQILPGDFGDITGLQAGAESADGIIFQENALTAMNFTGGQEIFTFDTIEGARGCRAPGSIVAQGGLVYYISDSGLYATDGVSVAPIGASQVDDFIRRVISANRFNEVRSAVDIREKYIYWFLPGFEDIALIYNYDIKEFSFAEGLGISVFVQALSTALTLEEIAVRFGGLDNMDLSLDDPQFGGDRLPVFSAFNSDNRLGPLSGPTLAATLRTPETEPVQDGRAYLQFSRPLVDTSVVTVSPVTRETLQEQPEKRPGTLIAAGTASSRVSARYWALDVDIPAGTDWEFAQGIQTVFEEAGNRDIDDISPTFTVPNFLLRVAGDQVLNDLGQPLIVVDRVDPIAGDFFLVTLGGDRITTLDGSELRATS